jgi:hypothetical protein
MKSKEKTPIEKFLALGDAEKDAEVARFDSGEIPLSQSRSLNASERKLWKRIKRGLGRPKIGLGAAAKNPLIGAVSSGRDRIIHPQTP